MAARPLEDWFRSIPPITKVYASACFITTLSVHLDLIKPLSLYLNFHNVFYQYEVWRLVTTFLWFGPFGLNFLFHMYFLIRHSSALEEGSFSGRASDYLYMLLFGAVMLLILDFICHTTGISRIMFLAPSLSFMVVYVWSRRNPHAVMALFGLFQFSAPYLPWVLLVIGLLLDQSPVYDILGILVGHIYFFCEDVYPKFRPNRRILKTPAILNNLVGQNPPEQPQDAGAQQPEGQNRPHQE